MLSIHSVSTGGWRQRHAEEFFVKKRLVKKRNKAGMKEGRKKGRNRERKKKRKRKSETIERG